MSIECEMQTNLMVDLASKSVDLEDDVESVVEKACGKEGRML